MLEEETEELMAHSRAESYLCYFFCDTQLNSHCRRALTTEASFGCSFTCITFKRKASLIRKWKNAVAPLF
jgi:hypothetical protein